MNSYRRSGGYNPTPASCAFSPRWRSPSIPAHGRARTCSGINGNENQKRLFLKARPFYEQEPSSYSTLYSSSFTVDIKRVVVPDVSTFRPKFSRDFLTRDVFERQPLQRRSTWKQTTNIFEISVLSIYDCFTGNNFLSHSKQFINRPRPSQLH